MRLLLISCSKRKRDTPEPLAALDRYDGPAYQVLRTARRAERAADVVTLILSAKFGLIAAEEPVHDYDQMMGQARAVELRDLIVAQAQRLLLPRLPVSATYIHMSSLYRSALDPSIAPVLSHLGALTFATGRPGERLQRLRTWLWQ